MSDFRIMVLDEDDGHLLTLTRHGASWLESHEIDWASPLFPGDAIGIAIPLDELYASRSGITTE